ncbi:carbohydrate ABC transporter permease [Brachybacterium fresconis]|uniref:Multiple sugar transport system permease protein n=1 Tax=Brachybacterium fresconis TaxID=173363 RepID=A0ABS4YMT4_9MICO|nr:sugar ABC transporter permease [Brachybacterium fresconis]MBP2410109.1 multiple sugar transport system permease protein [Brachybacterium fresconis]
MSSLTAPEDTTTPPKRPDARPPRRPRRHLFPYLIIAPAVLLELLIHIIPMATGFWMSFVELTKFFIRRWLEAPFVGLENYSIAIDLNTPVGQELLNSFLVTVGFTALVVGLSWGLGMAAAVALQRPFRGRGVFRTLFLIPYALPLYASVITWNFMLQRDTGVINHVLVDQLGILEDAPFWLIGDNAFVSVVVVAIWRMWPFAFLMFMAGLQSIPGELYEASAIDGAGPTRQWRSITLPMLAPVNQTMLLVMFLWVFNDFNTPYVLFGSAQPPAGDLISFHIYNASFLSWDFGVGSAMSVLLLLFLLAVSLVYLYFTQWKKEKRNA